MNHEQVRIPRVRETRLVTGPLGYMTYSRAEHARMLRMVSWAKRRRRRHGVPEATARGFVFQASDGVQVAPEGGDAR